jgi:hypothetical protein
MGDKMSQWAGKYITLLHCDPDAARKIYRSEVRRAVNVRSQEFESNGCFNVMYDVYAEAPPESFFDGADPESAKLAREVTRARRLGTVEAGIVTLDDFFGIKYQGKDSSSRLMYDKVRAAGLEGSDEVATIRGFYPLREAGAMSGSPSKLKGRGVGRRVLWEVTENLNKRGAKAIFVAFVSDEFAPLLKASGFEPLSENGASFYFKRV